MKLIVHAMKIKSGRVVTPLASACLKDVTGKKIAQVVMMKKAVDVQAGSRTDISETFRNRKVDYKPN